MNIKHLTRSASILSATLMALASCSGGGGGGGDPGGVGPAPGRGSIVGQAMAVVEAKLSSSVRAIERRAMMLADDAELRPAEVIVRLRDDVEPEVGKARVQRRGFEFVAEGGGFYLFRKISGPSLRHDAVGRAALADEIDALEHAVGDVDYATPNCVSYGLREPSDPGYVQQWSAPLTNLPQAWDITTGERVVIAVVDSGILAGHPDLAGRILPDGFDMISDPQNSGDGDGIDADPDEPYPTQTGFHGTHCAGIIGASANDGIGIAGVNWSADILPVRALGLDMSGTDFDITQAILYAAGLPNVSQRVPSKPAQIINLSLGGPGQSPNQADAIAAARQQGIIVVVSAGNDGERGNPVFYPAALQTTIAVAAVGQTGEHAPYSQFHPYIDIAAPGGDQRQGPEGGVLSTAVEVQQGQPYYGWKYYEGTSMAAPFISGVISLMLSVNANLTQDDCMQIFAQTAMDRGAPGKDDEYGHGLVDVFAAVQMAQTGGPAPGLAASQSSLTFSAGGADQRLQITGSGGAQFSNIQLAVSNDATEWLAAQLDTRSTPATLTVSVNPAIQGPRTGRVQLSAPGSQPLVITVQLGNAGGGGGGGGDLRVALFDAAQQPIADAVVNSGRFEFRDLQPGTYTMFAMKDLNGDGTIGAGDMRSDSAQVTVVAGQVTESGMLRATRR